ncbi:hypothetical protein GGI21_006339, partial [Coemansia aciculifera]
MRMQYDDGKHSQEQEQRLLAAATRKYADSRLRQMLKQWSNVAKSQASAETAADKHYYRLSRPINEVMCYNALFEWREQLKGRRQLAMSADKRQQVHVARKFLNTLRKGLLKRRELELEAVDANRTLVLGRTWMYLTQQYAMTRTSRVLTSMHKSDHEALISIANAGSTKGLARAVAASEPTVLDNTALIEDQELENYFSAWRMLVDDVRELQGAAMERLPVLLRQRAVRSLESNEGFDWGLVHQGRVLSAAIKNWRRQVPAARSARSASHAPSTGFGNKSLASSTATSAAQARGAIAERDGPNAVELRRYERMVVQTQEFRVKKTAFHR